MVLADRARHDRRCALTVYAFGHAFPDWTPDETKRRASSPRRSVLGYKAPGNLWLQEHHAQKRTDKRFARAFPTRSTCWSSAPRPALPSTLPSAVSPSELGRAYPELGDEFTLTSIELSFLNERRMAFENLAYRVRPRSGASGVVTTMIQTERYGTPLASALRVLSAEFRNERMMRAEEKAARLPAIMTVPLILFILPVLFIVILGPASCALSAALGDM